MHAEILKTPTIHIITNAMYDNPIVWKIYIHYQNDCLIISMLNVCVILLHLFNQSEENPNKKK